MIFDCRRWTASACLIAPISVLFACGPTDTYLNDTWIWSGGDWHQVSSNQGPGWRFGAVFVYDEATNQVVLFGGEDARNPMLSDTWTWDGHWILRHPASSPPARRWPAAAYDPVRRNVVVFGGDSGGYGDLSDTWVWDGYTWSQISVADVPPAQSFGPSPAAFDPISSRVILVLCWFGCSSFDTWSWDGESWRAHSAGTTEPTGPIYLDSIRGHVIRVGGLWWLSGRD